MGERKGHYLAGPTKPRLPASLFTLTVTPLLSGVTASPTVNIHRFGRAYITYARRYQDRWTAPEVVNCSTPESALAWMEERASKHKTNWVVAPIATDAMTLLKWWSYAEAQGVMWDQEQITSPLNMVAPKTPTPVVLSRAVLRGTPDIIRYTHRGLVWQWVSGYQYLPDGPGVMGDPSPDTPEYTRATRVRTLITQEWSSAEAMAWHRAMVRFMAWWGEHARAPWGCTIGQLATGMLRTHAPPKTLCTHSVSDVHALERAACVGGRATCWYVGSVGAGLGAPESHIDKEGDAHLRQVEGPVTHLDVSSMYPSLLRDEQFPVKFRFLENRIKPQKLVELAQAWGIIARVTLTTPVAEFPRRDGDTVVYPVGRFTATLAGPEIVECARIGTLENVQIAAIYSLARPFASCADALIRIRTSATSALPLLTSLPAKLLANSLGGKLAQRAGGWERCPQMDEPSRWGMQYQVNAQTGIQTRYRYLAGLAWRWSPDKTGSGPFTAAFAYLTSYGRLMMRRIRALCPPRSVVSQDTDGIWVLPAGLAAIRAAGLLHQVGAGHLRVVGSSTNARWYGPRHYCTDGAWTLAGFSHAVMDADSRTIWDTVKSSLWARRVHGAPEETVTTVRRSIIRPDIGGGKVAPDGWVIPLKAPSIAGAVDDTLW